VARAAASSPSDRFHLEGEVEDCSTGVGDYESQVSPRCPSWAPVRA